jgi:hypothetical protein
MMKSRTQLRTLTVTGVIALLMMMLSLFSVPATTYADGTGGDPPHVSDPIDTLSSIPSDTTGTATALSETTDPSLIDAVITILDVII